MKQKSKQSHVHGYDHDKMVPTVDTMKMKQSNFIVLHKGVKKNSHKTKTKKASIKSNAIGTCELLDFKKAWSALKQGLAVARVPWLGYWRLETFKDKNGNQVTGVAMHCKDGNIVRMDEGCDSILTFDNVVADDWWILSEDHLFSLDEMHNYMKQKR